MIIILNIKRKNKMVKISQKKKSCLRCGKEFFGRENKMYCSNECKFNTKKKDIVSSKTHNKLLYNKDDKEKDTTYSSIWLYRQGKMIPPFYDKINKENSYYSEFNPLTSQNITNFWSEEEDNILDPFAGRTRGIVSGLTKRKYYGFEISKEVYDKVQSVMNQGIDKFDIKYVPMIYNDDSFNLDKYDLPTIDLVFSCPPYWDLEKYPSTPGQLSDIKDYELFLKKFKRIMIKCCDKLKNNGYVCLVVGNFRKNGNLISFDTDTTNLMKEIPNIVLWDKIILQNVNFGYASKRFGAGKHKRITAKVSEYLLVFKKINNGSHKS